MKPSSRSLVLSVLSLPCLAWTLAGCSNQPARVPAPAINPASVVAAVFDLADADGDGSLQPAEQGTVPAIAAAASLLDTDGDAAVAREELLAWLEAVRDSRVAITPLEVTVIERGRPLADATVRLVPEPFMGDGVKLAEGVTGGDGTAVVTITDAVYPGVNCGLYRVEITGTGRDGKPLPPQVNTASTLGVAVGKGIPETATVQFRID